MAQEEEGDQKDGIEIILEHDHTLTAPGKVIAPKGTPYTVFSPFHRAWSSIMVKNLDKFSKEFHMPKANKDDIRKDQLLGKLFEDQVPECVEGFELPSDEYAETVRDLYPAGTDTAEEVSFPNRRLFELSNVVQPRVC